MLDINKTYTIGQLYQPILEAKNEEDADRQLERLINYQSQKYKVSKALAKSQIMSNIRWLEKRYLLKEKKYIKKLYKKHYPLL